MDEGNHGFSKDVVTSVLQWNTESELWAVCPADFVEFPLNQQSLKVCQSE